MAQEPQKTPRAPLGFGGRFVPELLWEPLQRVEDVYNEVARDESFVATYHRWLDHRLGRPTPLSQLEELSRTLGGATIWIKREDLCQGGSFCACAAVFYGLLARRLDVRRLVGETANGHFGVALGSVGRAMGLEVTVAMGRADIEAEPLQVARMQALGVEIASVDAPGRGRRPAAEEALQRWAGDPRGTLYCASTLAAPAPYPHILAQSLSVIGAEVRLQMERRSVRPQHLVAPVGSGGFAAGMFGPFLQDPLPDAPRLVGVEAGGEGSEGSRHAACLTSGRPGVLHGCYSDLLQDEEGQVVWPASAAAGLSVAQVGPQHAEWSRTGEVLYETATDAEALEATLVLAEREGIFCALEAGHALASGMRLARTLDADAHVIVGISGAGGYDREQLEELLAARQRRPRATNQPGGGST